jgi:Predicted membrane protein
MSQYMPQVMPTRRPLVYWLVSAAAVTLIVLLIVIAPVAAASGHSEIADGVYRGFGIFCHQRPDRSYFIEGHKLAVCSRCTGLYAGFAFTLLIYPLLRSLRSVTTPPRKVLFLAALPLLVDFSLTFFGVWENTHTSRLLTGVLLGSVVVFYVMPGIVDLSLRGLRLSTPPRPTFTLASPESIATAPSDYSAPERRI